MRVEYRVGDELVVMEMKGDPFAICDHVQRKLFPVLSDAGWQRLLARKAQASR